MLKKLIFIFLFTGILFKMHSQTDSTATEEVKNKKAVYSAARKATIMSAILPGLGQAYNKKYWKIPVMYAGLGGLGYFFYINNTSYNNYHNALVSAVKGNGYATVDGHSYDTGQLQTQKLYYRKYRDFAGIGIAAIYLLNIIDANVDAHLKTFDVSDDLSVHIDPWQIMYFTGTNNISATGVSIKLNFK